MSTPQQVLDVARGELGYVEQPAGSNRTKYGAWYGLNPAAWCAMFLSWCAAQAGALDVIPKHAYTPSGAAWYKARGAWGLTPRVGAIAYYDLAGLGRISHVGIVEAVHADGSWTAIEGNTDSAGGRTGGRVMRQRRSRVGTRGGFGYPAYDGVPTNPPPVQQPGGPGGSALLVVDGDLGPRTIARLQESLNRTGTNPPLVVDGQLGKLTITGLQWRLNHTNGPVARDGKLGPQTTRALQRNVGAAVDGQLGPQTISRLQATLNVREL